MKNRVTAERLHELLYYDPDTGVFTRRVAMVMPHGGIKYPVGSVAGAIKADGYVRIGIDGASYLASVLAWFYMTGQWPIGDVDHRDGVGTNNTWSNLRDISRQHNIQNRRRANRNSASGVLGVYPSPTPGKWCAAIEVSNGKMHLGTFATMAEARAVHLEAKRRMHPGCTI